MFVLLTVVFLFAGLAAAQSQTNQPLSCSAQTFITPMIRAEGFTELVGDIQIRCVGGAPFAPTRALPFIPTANVLVSLTNKVTSRLYTSTDPKISDAILMVDEPGSTNRVVVPGFGPGASLKLCGNPSNPAQGVVSGTCNQLVKWAEPATGTVVATENADATITGTPTATSVQVPYNADGSLAANAWQGILVSNSQVEFRGIPVLPPVTGNIERVYRITNIRVAAGGPLQTGNAAGLLQVQAFLTNSGSTSLPLGSSGPYVVANVSNSLKGEVFRAANTYTQCDTSKRVVKVDQLAGLVRFNELFPSAFKTRLAGIGTTAYSYSNPVSGPSSFAGSGGPTLTEGGPIQNLPGTIYPSETGFQVATTSIGTANTGTRFQAFLDKLPRGVQVYVTRGNVLAGSSKINAASLTTADGWNQAPAAANETEVLAKSYAEYTAPATANAKADNRAFTPVSATTYLTTTSGKVIPLIDVTPATYDATTNLGSTYVTWEVVNSNANTTETYDFGIFVAYTQGAAPNGQALPIVETNSTGSLGYGQQSQEEPTVLTSYIPRFYTSVTDPAIFFNVTRCQTLLLFPYVTTAGGYNTGFAIANTSKDPVGTPVSAPDTQCDLYAYGRWASAVDAVSIPKFSVAVPAGTVTTGLLSANIGASATGNKEFTGYMFASCNFQFAHGFAFISDFGQYSLGATQGYLALVVTNNSTVASYRPTTQLYGEALNN